MGDCETGSQALTCAALQAAVFGKDADSGRHFLTRLGLLELEDEDAEYWM